MATGNKARAPRNTVEILNIRAFLLIDVKQLTEVRLISVVV